MPRRRSELSLHLKGTTSFSSTKKTRNKKAETKTPKAKEKSKSGKEESFCNLLGSKDLLKARLKIHLPVALYIPNLLCYLRIILSFLALFYSMNLELSHEGGNESSIKNFYLVLWLYIIAMISDYFDGYFARLLHQESKMGILIDIIADNVLRSCMYITSIIHTVSLLLKKSEGGADYFNSLLPVLIVFCTFIIVIEWTTLIATQLYISKQGHWKLIQENDPLLVRSYFQNNFKNIIGGIGMLGLFGFPIIPFFCINIPQSISPYILHLKVFSGVTLCGRLISLYIECFFIYRYFESTIIED